MTQLTAPDPRRRSVLAATLAAVALPGLSRRGFAAEPTLRIGYQKYGTLPLLRARQSLEPALKRIGWSVSWAPFVGGPQLLEALAAGAIDFGQTGEAPPVLSQAAGSRVAYVACNPPAPAGEAIVVPSGSDIRDVAGLRGRTVAFNKGSNVQYLVIKALRSAGLRFSDIRPAFLAPADASAAFQQGAVDAWAIWDPFLAVAEATAGARVLVDAQGLAANRQFFLAAGHFAEAEPALLRTVLDAMDADDQVSKGDLPAAARLLAEAVGLPLPTAERCVSRLGLGVQPIGPEVVADQQAIADAFLAERIIPSRINVSDAVWKPHA